MSLGLLYIKKCALIFCQIRELSLFLKQNGGYFLNFRQKASSCYMSKQSVDEKLSLEHSDSKDMNAP